MRTSEHSGCYKKGRVFSRPIWGLNPQNWMINDNHQKLAHLDERLRFSRQNQPKIGVRVTKIGGLSAGKDVNQWVSILEGIWMRERERVRDLRVAPRNAGLILTPRKIEQSLS